MTTLLILAALCAPLPLPKENPLKRAMPPGEYKLFWGEQQYFMTLYPNGTYHAIHTDDEEEEFVGSWHITGGVFVISETRKVHSLKELCPGPVWRDYRVYLNPGDLKGSCDTRAVRVRLSTRLKYSR